MILPVAKGVFVTSVLLSAASFARMVESSLPDELPGGISSLCRISADEYFAVRDRGELLRLKIQIDPESGSLDKCEMVSRVKVKARPGDFEALCRSSDGRLFVTDDCGRSAYEITPTGKVVKELSALKTEFSSAKYNLGAEAMEFGSFGMKDCLWTMTELPRTNDVGRLKLFKYSIRDDRILASYDYDYDYAVVDFLNDPKDGSLLVMERDIGVKPKLAFWKGLNYISIKIFRVKIKNDGTIEKTELFRSDTGSVNYEGMEWAPDSADGRRRVILISDKDVTNRPIRVEWFGRIAVIDLE
jgi:hypothetical protein